MQSDAVRNYTRTDQDLIAWHTSISDLYERISRMAVVGVVTDTENGLQLGVTTPRGVPLPALPSFERCSAVPMCLVCAATATAW